MRLVIFYFLAAGMLSVMLRMLLLQSQFAAINPANITHRIERMQAAQLALIDYAEAATRPDRRRADVERRAAEVRGLLEEGTP